MKILFIGDIVAKPGRETVRALLPGILKEHKPDLVLANPENLSHGDGFSLKNINEMRELGVDFFTSGNHVWANKDGASHLDDPDFPVLRPANFEVGVPGRGYGIVKAHDGTRVLVISIIGRAFMRWHFDCPFKAVDRILKEAKKYDAVFVDFHAETTAEKKAMGFYLDGRVSVLVGTHTHVQTNDAQILEKGTAYITDVGMTGSVDSVIGVNKELILEQFLMQMPVKHEPETKGRMALSAFLVELDPKSKRALNVKNILQFKKD